MTVKVEFLGMTRRWAGRDSLDVQAQDLGEAIKAVTETIPELGMRCFDDGRLRNGFLIGVNCGPFTSDRATRLSAGDTVQLLSADAGG